MRNSIFDTQYLYAAVHLTFPASEIDDIFEYLDKASEKAREEISYMEKELLGDYGYAEIIDDLYMEEDYNYREGYPIFVYKKTIKPIVITRPIKVI